MGSVSKPDILYIKSFQILCRIGISMLARSKRMEPKDFGIRLRGGLLSTPRNSWIKSFTLVLHLSEYFKKYERYGSEILGKCSKYSN